jgi:type VI secretion system protein ImpF
MARTDNEIRITPSVIDRLLDFEPQMSQEAAKSRSKSLRELKQSVRRDLEWLLNTRCYPEDVDENLAEVLKSVVFFGLPDFTAVSAKSHVEQKRLRQALETAIRNFEPRLYRFNGDARTAERRGPLLKFRIEANLDIEPTPEPIVFDTILQLGGGSFSVVEK